MGPRPDQDPDIANDGHQLRYWILEGHRQGRDEAHLPADPQGTGEGGRDRHLLPAAQRPQKASADLDERYVQALKPFRALSLIHHFL